MTNDSTYQLDNALLISDEGNGTFSDIQIVVWRHLVWKLTGVAHLVCCNPGGRRISVSRSCKVGS